MVSVGSSLSADPIPERDYVHGSVYTSSLPLYTALQSAAFKATRSELAIAASVEPASVAAPAPAEPATVD